MKMRSYIIIFLITILMTIPCAQPVSDSLRSDIQLRTFIESDNVPLNREVVYHVELRWQGDLNKYQVKEIQEPALINLSTRGSGSSNKVHTTPGGDVQSVKRITFYLIPGEIGMSYIDGLTIRYTDSASGKDASLISSRIGIKIVEPVPEPGSSPWIDFLMWGVILIVVAGGFLYIFNRYQKNKEAERIKNCEL